MPMSPIRGGYLTTELDGDRCRIYVEQSGDGIPLVCQHTAGTDGRQWRHLQEDPDVLGRFRVVVPDLPYHGKSLPPEVDWWARRYSLSTDYFTRFVVRVADELALDRPVYLGCSMGGHLAGDLALRFPDRFRAVIGVEAALATHGPEETLLHNDHPRVGNEFKAAMMYSLTSPQAPEAGRREATWYYLQSAPQAHRGDLDYYIHDHDLTATAGLVDTSRVAVHVLSGEYDWSAPPEAGRALADRIPGADHTTMPGLGHFPMVEDYPRFRQHLLPVLDRIAAAAVRS